MNLEKFANGRYLMDKEHCENPYEEAALRHGQRENRDAKPLQNQTARRMAAPKFIEEESKLQTEAERCAVEGLVQGKEWWLRIKLARGTSNIDKLPKKDVLWDVLRYLKLNKGTVCANTVHLAIYSLPLLYIYTGTKRSNTIPVIRSIIDEHLKKIILHQGS